MAIKIAQTKTGTSTLASTIITWNGNTITGNTIVVAVATNLSTDVSGITDSQGNTYVNALIANGTGIEVELWYAKNILGGATPTVTIAYTSAPTASVIIQEYSGIDTVTVLDQTKTNTGNSNSLDSGATTKTNQGLELLIGVGAAVSATFTAGGSFVNLTQQANATIDIGIEDLLVTSTGTYNATFGASGSIQWACGIASFRAAPQGTTTSTSSTSASTFSTSSTSSSISSTSVSTSSTSGSTSLSSTSSSISSTSSSISSTSSSSTSVSTSSTSSSTSVSSTSSSISSTSFSSTSQSSTSSSTSISSTSSSFSSTSSSVSSTSASTSSTSFSSTSSSSSTSTTAIPSNLIYSYQDTLTLPTTSVNDIDIDTSKNVQNVAVDDSDYFIQYGSKYMIQEYKKQWTNNTDTPSFTWKGRSTVSTSTSPMYLQIYNQNSATWETIDTETLIPVDTDFILSGSRTANVSNYYDTRNIVTFRVYQQVV